jgi:hypothetical protein
MSSAATAELAQTSSVPATKHTLLIANLLSLEDLPKLAPLPFDRDHGYEYD